ncbi:hypothetical protein VAPA_2c13110 [Variovorax paradoxus B4]|uniref:Uncharacterized protein n=1 Tax=Variovorax paradoxus B4 TaxID=1246301 RepID=T1XMM4_VARPD|nr:hypothetical protein [Variovorax paradoxus]AGU53863.1 hypothetical protein VAPA_2c13110 [Variovorax paradoxus B4]
MRLESSLTEQQLITQFLDALRELPEVRADLAHLEPIGSIVDRGHDAQIDLQVAGKSFILLVEAKKAVYPRDVRQVIWQFREASHGWPRGQGKEPLSLLVAESISPGAKELLRDERVGYYDSGGSMYLPAPGAYFYIDKPPPKTLTKSVRSLFSGRRAQVLHAVLIQHQDWFGVKELAQHAMVSPATASQVLTELERFDWLVSRGQGPSKERHLREPTALLDAWVKQLASIRPPTFRRYYVPATKADALLERVGEVFDAHDAGYAISHEAAAQRYSPFLSSVSQVRARLLIGSSADAAIRDLGARMVNEGANLAIIEAKSPGDLLFRERVDGIWLASPVQVYLDLLRGEGRSKEMAEHLRKERIGF